MGAKGGRGWRLGPTHYVLDCGDDTLCAGESMTDDTYSSFVICHSARLWVSGVHWVRQDMGVIVYLYILEQINFKKKYL